LSVRLSEASGRVVADGWVGRVSVSGRLEEGLGVAERSQREGCVAGGDRERLVWRWSGRLSVRGERLPSLSLPDECGVSPKRACMDEGRVEVGGGRDPEEDGDFAPVLMTRPSGLVPKGMVRRARVGEMGAAVLLGRGSAEVLRGDVGRVVRGVLETGAGIGRSGGCSGLEEPGSV
jgi:hypothetical protein